MYGELEEGWQPVEGGCKNLTYLLPGQTVVVDRVFLMHCRWRWLGGPGAPQRKASKNATARRYNGMQRLRVGVRQGYVQYIEMCGGDI